MNFKCDFFFVSYNTDLGLVNNNKPQLFASGIFTRVAVKFLKADCTEFKVQENMSLAETPGKHVSCQKRGKAYYLWKTRENVRLVKARETGNLREKRGKVTCWLRPETFTVIG